MTDQELQALKELAQKAKPFDESSEAPVAWEEMTEEDHARARANAEFFLAVHSALPGLIDELLASRKSDGERIENVAEWKKQNTVIKS